MKQNKEKNEIHLENKIDEDKINQDTNENNNKGNKNNEVKERKPVKTVGEIADVFLTDTLDLMSYNSLTLNGDYLINGPKLLDDWINLLKHREYYSLFIDPINSQLNFMEINMQNEHFGHGKPPITIPSEHLKQRLNEVYSMRQKNDGEYEIKQLERRTQERQARNEQRKKKQISPQMEDCNKDENKNM